MASVLLMAVILVVMHKKGLRGFGGIVIGGIVGLVESLWVYWAATFIGTSIIATIFRKKF
jgi:aquaporin Z